MGKRRHCQSREEVIRMMWERKRQQSEPQVKQIMRNANHARQEIEQARKRMREGDRK